jgi:hypothetical protein
MKGEMWGTMFHIWSRSEPERYVVLKAGRLLCQSVVVSYARAMARTVVSQTERR